MIMSSSEEFGKGESPVELAQNLETYVRRAAAEGLPLHEVERNAFDVILRIGHRAVEGFLQLQGNGDLGESVTTETGQVLQRSSVPVDRPLRTVFGLHTIEAFVYAPSPKEKILLRPVDARLQLSQRRTSYLFEEFSQHFCVEQAFGQASSTIQSVLRQKISVDSLESINRRLGEQAEDFLDDLPTPNSEEEGELLVFTGDGKGVPLVTKDVANLAAFEEAPDRPGNRKMAILAGVYSVDRHVRTPEQIVSALFRDEPRSRQSNRRPKPRFKHIRACFARVYDADTDEPTVVSGAFEAFAWAEQQIATRLIEGQPLIRLMDGQRSLWDAADACLESAPPSRTSDILDILHVSEYVWRVAKVFHKSFEHREAFARDRLLRILRGEIQGVILGIKQMAGRRNLTAKDRIEVAKVCGYFNHNVDRMRYDEYLKKGYPIATGVIEGACRHFVKDRMERSGMRWCLDGAQPMLNVRAVFLSSYWDEFHRWRIEQEQNVLHPNRGLIADYVPFRLCA